MAMPKKVKKVIRTKKVAPVVTPAMPSTPKYNPVLVRRVGLAVIVLLVIATLVFRYKNLFVVAMVDNRPVFRWEFETKLVAQSGAQVLDEVINEKIIAAAGAKNGITISAAEVDSKIAEIEKSLGGQVTLTDALAAQGLSLDEFKNQIKLQLTLEKLAGDKIIATDLEVSDYIASNSGTTAQDAKTAVEMQKKNTVLRELFSSLKSSAKVTKYL